MAAATIQTTTEPYLALEEIARTTEPEITEQHIEEIKQNPDLAFTLLRMSHYKTLTTISEMQNFIDLYNLACNKNDNPRIEMRFSQLAIQKAFEINKTHFIPQEIITQLFSKITAYAKQIARQPTMPLLIRFTNKCPSSITSQLINIILYNSPFSQYLDTDTHAYQSTLTIEGMDLLLSILTPKLNQEINFHPIYLNKRLKDNRIIEIAQQNKSNPDETKTILICSFDGHYAPVYMKQNGRNIKILLIDSTDFFKGVSSFFNLYLSSIPQDFTLELHSITFRSQHDLQNCWAFALYYSIIIQQIESQGDVFETMLADNVGQIQNIDLHHPNTTCYEITNPNPKYALLTQSMTQINNLCDLHIHQPIGQVVSDIHATWFPNIQDPDLASKCACEVVKTHFVRSIHLPPHDKTAINYGVEFFASHMLEILSNTPLPQQQHYR